MQVCKENPKFGGEGQKLKKAACRNRVCENQENQQVRVQNLFENVCIFIFRFRSGNKGGGVKKKKNHGTGVIKKGVLSSPKVLTPKHPNY